MSGTELEAMYPVVETLLRSISSRPSERINQEHSLNREYVTRNLRPQTVKEVAISGPNAESNKIKDIANVGQTLSNELVQMILEFLNYTIDLTNFNQRQRVQIQWANINLW